MSSDFPFGTRMVCYSHQNARLWSLHQVVHKYLRTLHNPHLTHHGFIELAPVQLEAHFATVNSQVVSLRRVEGARRTHCPARILALAEVN